MATLEEQIAEVKSNPKFEEFKTKVSALTNLNPENEGELAELQTKLAQFEADEANFKDEAPAPTPEQQAAADKAKQDKEKVVEIVKDKTTKEYYAIHNLKDIEKSLEQQLKDGQDQFEKDFYNAEGLTEDQAKAQGKEEDKKRLDAYIKKQADLNIIKQEIEFQSFKGQKNPYKETYLKDIAEWEARTGIATEKVPDKGMGVAFKDGQREEFEKFNKPREDHRDVNLRIEFAKSGYGELIKSTYGNDPAYAAFAFSKPLNEIKTAEDFNSFKDAFEKHKAEQEKGKDKDEDKKEKEKLVIERKDDEQKDPPPHENMPDWQIDRYQALRYSAEILYPNDPGHKFKHDTTRVPKEEQWISVGNIIAHSPNKNLMQLSMMGNEKDDYKSMAFMGVNAAIAGNFYVSFNEKSGHEFNLHLMIEAMNKGVDMDPETKPDWDNLPEEVKAPFAKAYEAAKIKNEQLMAVKLNKEKLKSKIADIKAAKEATEKSTPEGEFNKKVAGGGYRRSTSEEELKELVSYGSDYQKHVRGLRGIATDQTRTTKERLEAQAEIKAIRAPKDAEGNITKQPLKELMYEREVEKDADGKTKYEPLKDAKGNIIYEEVKDKEGKVVNNPDGTPKMQEKPDTRRPVYKKDDEGNWVYTLEGGNKKLSDYGKKYNAVIAEMQKTK